MNLICFSCFGGKIMPSLVDTQSKAREAPHGAISLNVSTFQLKLDKYTNQMRSNHCNPV